MGSFKLNKEYQGGWASGKIDASLNKMLATVEWGEYSIGELFDVLSSKKIFHANNITIYSEQIEGSYPYIVRATTHNGQRGYIKAEKNDVNRGNCLSFAQDTFTVFYQKDDFVTGNKVKVLKPRFKDLNGLTASFIISVINHSISHLSWGDGSDVKMIESIKFPLPIKRKNIDFDFMEKFIAELEVQHIAELEEYLLVSKLKDYTLTDEEKEFIGTTERSSKDISSLMNDKLKKIEWSEYRIGDLFDRIKTNKLPYKAKELPSNAIGKYVLPCLTSSFMNQGLNYFVPKENATILKNVISIPSNSDVYRAYYQSKDFTVLSDAYAICWKDKKVKITPNQYLFMVLCINKVTDLPIYSYKNKLGGWNVVKNKHILLPQTNGTIDFDFMEKIISILKKLAIKDVVLYADEKSEITKIL